MRRGWSQAVRFASSKQTVVKGRLRVQGRALRYPDGTRFPWVGATAFQVPELVAHGREPEAIAFLDAMRDAGITIVRFFASARFPGFVLHPWDGRAAVARAVDLAQERGLYSEVVAWVDTLAYQEVGLREQLAAIGAVAATKDTMVVEAGNEAWPVHGTQDPLVGDLDYLVETARFLAPAHVPFSFGSVHGGNSGVVFFDVVTNARGNVYLTFHDERTDGDRGWRPWRQTRYCEELSSRYGVFVVSDEPMRFGRTGDQDPAHAFAYGLLGRIFGVGTTFHFDNGRFARLPDEVEGPCLEAFVRGASFFPPNWEDGRHFENANTPESRVWPRSPVGPFDQRDTVRVFSSVAGDEAVSVAIGAQHDPGILWQNGFVPFETIRNPFGYNGVWIIASRR